MEPSQFLFDLLVAMVGYFAFVIGGVALVGGLAKLRARLEKRDE